MEIIKEIANFPVIVQGALGSALFWIIFVIGQKVIKFLNQFGKEKEIANAFSLMAELYDGEERHTSFLVCLYGGLHYLIKALIAISISLLLSNILEIISSIGYFLSLYFLFRALFFLPYFNRFPTKEEKQEKLNKVLKQLVNKNKDKKE
ncbi:hypothetical protein EHQ53_15110 [Leptospira langatensis]|uniref:Uncharacterized protein n=1 Tax=Leptospira langatensis TaxID=2484983 RepID=A0A5F1ZPK3_9LEPT|nr:hypothetical protein [Leptospira langatensis]TGK01803.1 hypothetical protein EHO57_08350 [Leptospira langatensis]TGL39409.1 hypothetical protein EHQ53_15110 [Leptospira langatensis]